MRLLWAFKTASRVYADAATVKGGLLRRMRKGEHEALGRVEPELCEACRATEGKAAIMVELALTLLAKLAERDDAYRAANDQIRALQPESPTHLRLMDDHIAGPLFDLLDAPLGDELASYFFYEARNMRGGAIIEADGTRWPIKSVEDVRAYVMGRDK